MSDILHSIGVIAYRNKDSAIEYLLVKHPEGHWGFIKQELSTTQEWDPVKAGTLTKEKNKQIAAQQLLKQHTGLEGIIEPLWHSSLAYAYNSYERKSGDKYVYFLLAKLPNESIILERYEDHQWLSHEDAHKKLTYDGAKKILNDANQFLQNKIPKK